MSLTNPDKLVTEERLNEYHNTILPYLGGMPDILANKFSRGDMYSTDEKMIGQWIDGKPLYQKTLDIQNPAKSTSIAADIQNVSFAMKHGVWFEISNGSETRYTNPFCNGNDYMDCTIYKNNPNNVLTLQLFMGANTWTGFSVTHMYVTLQYTKITDSPVAIGIDTDYSTEEKIVGTWIDGKPLYQKTFEFTPQSGEKPYNHGLSNIDNIFIVSSSSYLQTIYNGVRENWTFGSWNGTTETTFFSVFPVFADATKFNIYIGSGVFDRSQKMFVTAQYTKTS